MKKTKVFISGIPFLGQRRLEDGTLRDMLASVRYTPVGNTRLFYDRETRFPIVPVINGYANIGDTVRVVAIMTDGERSNAINTKRNFDTYFEPEIMAIAAAKNLNFEKIEVVHTPDNEDINTQLKLFSDVADRVNPGDEIFACISYGTKPMPIVLTMALNYACKLKKDVTVGCIVYGRYPHMDEPGGESLIYDTTPLFYMDSIVNKLAEIKAGDPVKAIRLMLGLETAEDM